VEITGFDGNQYMQNVAAVDPDIGPRYANFKTELAGLVAAVSVPTPDLGQSQTVDTHRIALARGHFTSPTGFPTNTNLTRAIAHYMGTNLAPGASRNFLISRFEALTDSFTGIVEHHSLAAEPLDRARSNRLSRMSIDILTDLYQYDKMGLVKTFASSIDINRPGSAFFQGLVYTHGYFHATEEVTIVGAVAALISTSGPAVPSEQVDPAPLDTAPPTPLSGYDTLNPGDIYLLDGSRIIFVEEFFKPRSVYPGPGGEGCDLVLWMGR
jgi:hypothetical protein